MNKVFMNGYYQGVLESAPAVLSADKTADLAATATIQHLRYENADSKDIHDFLIDDLHLDKHLVSSLLNLDHDQLESHQAQLIRFAYQLNS